MDVTEYIHLPQLYPLWGWFIVAGVMAFAGYCVRRIQRHWLRTLLLAIFIVMISVPFTGEARHFVLFIPIGFALILSLMSFEFGFAGTCMLLATPPTLVVWALLYGGLRLWTRLGPTKIVEPTGTSSSS